MTISFPAFRSRNYRLYFGGQSISLIGTWMTRVATSWLVYRLTDSAFLLGVVGFLGQIPALFLSPLAGVWVDRWDRHQAMVITQALAMVQSLALAVLTLTHTINMPWIFFLTFLQGVINTFETPARQSFVIQMIDDRSALSNAIALNSSIVNAGLDPDNLAAGNLDTMKFGSEGSNKSKAWRDIWGSGQGIGAVDKVRTASDLVDLLAQQYAAARARICAI